MDNKVLTQPRSEAAVSGFLSRVFLWMALGLGVSAAGSWWLLAQPELLMAMARNQWIFFGLVIAELALVIWLSAAIMTMGTGLATTLFFVYSFLNGLTLSPLFLIYTGASILSTFAVTSGTFFFFALYGLTTKRDLTSMGGLLMMGLIGILLASLVNIFLKSSGLYWAITFIGIAVFMGLVAWDTQKLKAMHAAGFAGADGEKRMVILGALRLYLDFINLFILLLRIFGRRRE
jgi:FtsH-binding integral membrane protein